MNLSKVVAELNKVKNDLKVAKNREKTLNEQVKRELQSQGLETVLLDDVNLQVTCKEVTRTEIDEDKLVKILLMILNDTNNEDLKDELKQCLVLKYSVDEDKVQELIYKGFIDIETIQPAVIEKTHSRLTIKEVR